MNWKRFDNVVFIAALGFLIVSLGSYIYAMQFPNGVVTLESPSQNTMEDQSVFKIGMFIGLSILAVSSLLFSIGSLAAFKAKKIITSRSVAVRFSSNAFILAVIFFIGVIYWN